MSVLVHITDFATDILNSVPFYHLVVESLLACWIIWLLFRKSYKLSDVAELTEKEKDELIAEWNPNPLVPDTPQNHVALNLPIIQKKAEKFVEIDDKQFLNAASLNFLGLIGNKQIEDAAEKAILKYGVGSCGPRGFYGTIDVHLELEKKLAELMGCEEAILYSYGFPTMASAIPAYAKRGDVIFCDKGANFAIQKGVQASRSRVEFFDHNDMQDLHRVLELQARRDEHNPKKAKATRRFLVVEGIYLNSGDVCPLPQLIEFKWKYKVRLFIDESVSFGVLGKHGKGVTEHFNVNVEDVDLICGSLENAIASTGGFCCGRSYVVDHQRLSGSGYCFSASSPPFLASAALEAFKVLQDEPYRFDVLARNCRLMHEKLNGLTYLRSLGEAVSPIFHLSLKTPEKFNVDEKQLLHQLTLLLRNHYGIVVVMAGRLEHEEMFPVRPSIRVAVSSHFEDRDILHIANSLELACKDLFQNLD